MRMFHFLAFHKAPVLFVERFFYEKYIFDACQVTKIVLEIFVFGLTVLHFLSLPKIDWCLIRWRNRVSIYTIIFIPLYMLLLNLMRLYLTSQPTDYDACVRVNDGTVRIVPFHISC